MKHDDVKAYCIVISQLVSILKIIVACNKLLN